MTNLDYWIKACEEFDTKIFTLDKKNNVALYSTKKHFMPDGKNTMYEVFYHVWFNNDKHFCCNDYRLAYSKYKRVLECNEW